MSNEIVVNGKAYLTADGVALRTGRSRATVVYWSSNWHGDKRLAPACYVGATALFDEAAAVAFFAEKRRAGAATLNREHKVRRRKSALDNS